MTEPPSVRERRLAAELRTLRLGAEMHGKDVASVLGWSPSKVSRIETARIGISPEDLERLLRLYDVPEAQAGTLRRLAPSARPKGWWDAYADTLSAGYAGLIRLESGSRTLQCYCALVPHALLQTPEFARTVIESTWQRPSAAEVERRVQVCRRRQQVLDRLRLSAVIDEAVLRRAVPPAVLAGQLDSLIAVADRPTVSIQVLPFSAGLPPVTAGSFSILESLATGTPDVVYLENKTRISFVDAEAEIYRYTRDFDLLTSMALAPGESLDLLRATRATLG